MSALYALILIASATAPTSAPSAAPAADEHRMWASFGFGPAAGVSAAALETTVFGQTVEAEYHGPTQIKLVQTFGYQLFGTRLGPAAGVELQESFGDRHFLFQIVPRIEWSFALPVIEEVPLLGQLQVDLTPSFGAGIIHFSREAEDGLGASGNGFTFQLAIEARLKLFRRFFFSLRPIEIVIQSLELTSGQVQDWGTFVRYSFLFGGGVRF